MPSSRKRWAFALASVVLAALAHASSSAAQQQAQGFASERLYLSAPGGGWLVMDTLDMHGGLGGAMAFTTSYAHDPLRVTDGVQHLAVVSDQAFADFGFAVTYDRWRLYFNLDMPLDTDGQGGTVGGYQFTPPSVDLGSHPDSMSDARIGFDGRLVGDPGGPFRLGAGAQLFVPNGDRADYDTDDTYRAMGRVLFAGDVGLFSYAGHLGVHIRPLDDAPIPGSPRGSEALFGLAGGPRFLVDASGRTAVVVGPEIYGETAFRSFLGSTGTGVEGLLTGRVEGTRASGPQIRAKLGVGGGLNPRFGAPAWRVVFGIELFDHGVVPDGRRDKAALQPPSEALP